MAGFFILYHRFFNSDFNTIFLLCQWLFAMLKQFQLMTWSLHGALFLGNKKLDFGKLFVGDA